MFPAPLVTRARRLADSSEVTDRRYPGLWSQVSIRQAYSLVNVGGTWSALLSVSTTLRATATRVIDGGYQGQEVTAAELAAMVRDGVITAEDYLAITGEDYVEPPPSGGGGTDPGGGPIRDPDDPLDPWLTFALTTEDGTPIGTEEGAALAVEA